MEEAKVLYQKKITRAERSRSKLVPKLRFKGFEEEWVKILIQDLIDNKTIISHLDGNHGGLYPRNEEFSSTGVPYISANDFITGKVLFTNCKHLPEKRAALFKKGIAKNGDVLFAHNATVGPTKTWHLFTLALNLLRTVTISTPCSSEICLVMP